MLIAAGEWLRAELSEEDKEGLLNLPYKLKTVEAQTYAICEADPPRQCGVLVPRFAFRQKLIGNRGNREDLQALVRSGLV